MYNAHMKYVLLYILGYSHLCWVQKKHSNSPEKENEKHILFYFKDITFVMEIRYNVEELYNRFSNVIYTSLVCLFSTQELVRCRLFLLPPSPSHPTSISHFMRDEYEENTIQ